MGRHEGRGQGSLRRRRAMKAAVAPANFGSHGRLLGLREYARKSASVITEWTPCEPHLSKDQRGSHGVHEFRVAMVFESDLGLHPITEQSFL